MVLSCSIISIILSLFLEWKENENYHGALSGINPLQLYLSLWIILDWAYPGFISVLTKTLFYVYYCIEMICLHVCLLLKTGALFFVFVYLHALNYTEPSTYIVGQKKNAYQNELSVWSYWIFCFIFMHVQNTATIVDHLPTTSRKELLANSLWNHKCSLVDWKTFKIQHQHNMKCCNKQSS
mgnify:CR=1 FL=1